MQSCPRQCTGKCKLLLDKDENICKIKDVAIPEDCAIRANEGEKIDKWQDLAREVQRIGVVSRRPKPVVVVAFTTVPLRLKGILKDLGASILGKTGALVSNQGRGLCEDRYLGRGVHWCLTRDEASGSIDTWADRCTGV